MPEKIEPEYEIIPYTDGDEAFGGGSFQYPLSHKQILKCGDGKIVPKPLLERKIFKNDRVKRSAENGVVMRWVNYSDRGAGACDRKKTRQRKSFIKSDILERTYDVIPEENGQWRIKAEP